VTIGELWTAMRDYINELRVALRDYSRMAQETNALLRRVGSDLLKALPTFLRVDEGVVFDVSPQVD
jgi:hypothetical protein